MSYIEGFVVPVPSNRKDAYREMCAKASKVFAEYGALRVVECWADDVPPGKVTDFQRAVQSEKNETIVFSWIEWPSKEIRDAANAKMKDDPRMQPSSDMPFDGKRMITGGFVPMFDSKNEMTR